MGNWLGSWLGKWFGEGEPAPAGSLSGTASISLTATGAVTGNLTALAHLLGIWKTKAVYQVGDQIVVYGEQEVTYLI